MTITIAIACHAGGVGKTTTTLHLANALFQHHAVLAIDLDPQHSLSSATVADWTAEEEPCMMTSDLLTGRRSLRSYPLFSVDDAWMIVPTDMSLQETAAWLQLQTITHDHLSTAVAAEHEFDAILIDCPPAADLLTINALCAADYVIVPVIPEPKGLDGLNRMVELVDWLNRKRVSHAQILGMVVTQMDARTKGHQAGVLDLQRTGVPVLAEIPMAKGQDADSKLRHAYAPLVSAVLEKIQEARHA